MYKLMSELSNRIVKVLRETKDTKIKKVDN